MLLCSLVKCGSTAQQQKERRQDGEESVRQRLCRMRRKIEARANKKLPRGVDINGRVHRKKLNPVVLTINKCL
jgi:hypothetical protein